MEFKTINIMKKGLCYEKRNKIDYVVIERITDKNIKHWAFLNLFIKIAINLGYHGVSKQTANKILGKINNPQSWEEFYLNNDLDSLCVIRGKCLFEITDFKMEEATNIIFDGDLVKTHPHENMRLHTKFVKITEEKEVEVLSHLFSLNNITNAKASDYLVKSLYDDSYEIITEKVFKKKWLIATEQQLKEAGIEIS